jgi:uncharacterized membrane protein YhiD involved in acid resistance
MRFLIQAILLTLIFLALLWVSNRLEKAAKKQKKYGTKHSKVR